MVKWQGYDLSVVRVEGDDPVDIPGACRDVPLGQHHALWFAGRSGSEKYIRPIVNRVLPTDWPIVGRQLHLNHPEIFVGISELKLEKQAWKSYVEDARFSEVFYCRTRPFSRLRFRRTVRRTTDRCYPW